MTVKREEPLLPEWIKEPAFRLSASGSKDYKLVEALTLAIAALRKISKTSYARDCDATASNTLIEIERLGDK